MWTADRRTVKITDFGVAHSSWAQRLAESGDQDAARESTDALFDDSELAKTAGTPSFLAPEVVWNGPSGDAQVSPSPSTISNNHSQGHGHGLLAHLSSGSIVHMNSARNSASTVHLSPQQSDRPRITKAIDVWALGVTLYCLLFGEIPFRAETEWALYQVIATEDWNVKPTMGLDEIPTGGRHLVYGPNGKLSEGGVVISLLNGLLEKDAARRITLDEVKVRDLISWLDISSDGIFTLHLRLSQSNTNGSSVISLTLCNGSTRLHRKEARSRPFSTTRLSIPPFLPSNSAGGKACRRGSRALSRPFVLSDLPTLLANAMQPTRLGCALPRRSRWQGTTGVPPPSKQCTGRLKPSVRCRP